MKLQLKGLQKTFYRRGSFGERHPVEALRDINLSVEAGEFVTVIGPSGSGKSTLLMIVAGLVGQSGGDVTLDGQAVRGPGLDRGVVFQDFALFPWLDVDKNVRFGLKNIGMSTREQRNRTGQLLSLVGLAGFESSYPHQLSGGMQQRVAIARALAYDPEILLMDEPFGALDAQTRSTMQAELQRIWTTTAKTVLFVTHSVREAVFLADRVIVLSARPGQIMAEVAVDLARPRNVFSPEFSSYEEELTRMLAPKDGTESGEHRSVVSD